MPHTSSSYPVDDGDITVIGRLQQIAVAVWVLGFMGGPLPAIVALLVRPGHGTYQRLLVTAAWFWTVAVLVGALSVWLAVSQESMWYMAGWVGVVAVGFVATGVAVWTALHRI